MEYTFFNLFPQNVSAVQVGYDASKILTASATFEYTRYVCGPISNISKYRSSAGYNNLTVADLKQRPPAQEDVTQNDVNDKIRREGEGTLTASVAKKERVIPKYEQNRRNLRNSRSR